MLKFHLDENVDFALAHALRRRGLDVTTTPPDLPKGTSDEIQLEYCCRTRRVIITSDRDILAMVKAGAEHEGAAFFYFRTRTIGQLMAGLRRWLVK